jgi:DNA-directed RNA polymerase subunit RPC12/RpoP
MRAMAQDGTSSKQVCGECRGALVWDAAARALRCQQCGALRQIEEDGVIAEHDLLDALGQRKQRGKVGAGTRLVRCGDCHAEVEVPDELAATRCEFCGSTLVLATSAADDHYLPESLIPFSVDRAAAVRAFQEWLGGLWLRPSNLRQAASLHELSGIYIPYWSFGCEVTSRWSADAGYTFWVDEKTKEGTRRVARVRWQPCSGQRHDGHEDHLVCASHGLPPGTDRAVHRFDTSGLLPYSPEYLLGFSAERYALDLRGAWQAARRNLGTQQERRCAQDVPGDTQRGLRVTHEFRGVRFKHVLLPMWIAAYRYHGKLHRFIVNGQTGQVQGSAPRSAVKIGILVSMVLMMLAGILWYLHARTPRPQLF